MALTHPEPDPRDADRGPSPMTDSEVACLRCEHCRRYAWIGPPATLAHCDGCHRDWPQRNQQCHCAGCHRHFKGVRAFDLHQIGDCCIDPAIRTDTAARPLLRARHTPHGLIWSRHGDSKPPSASSSCTKGPTDAHPHPNNPDGS